MSLVRTIKQTRTDHSIFGIDTYAADSLCISPQMRYVSTPAGAPIVITASSSTVTACVTSTDHSNLQEGRDDSATPAVASTYDSTLLKKNPPSAAITSPISMTGNHSMCIVDSAIGIRNHSGLQIRKEASAAVTNDATRDSNLQNRDSARAAVLAPLITSHTNAQSMNSKSRILMPSLNGSAPHAGDLQSAQTSAADPGSPAIAAAAAGSLSALELDSQYICWHHLAQLNQLAGSSAYSPLPEWVPGLPPYPGCRMKTTTKLPQTETEYVVQPCSSLKGPWGGVCGS